MLDFPPKTRVNLHSKEVLEALIEMLAETIIERLEKGGALEHHYFLWNANGEFGHDLAIARGLPLEVAVPSINLLSKAAEETKLALGLVVHASEAWVASRLDGDERPASQREDRKECILIEGKTRYGVCVALCRRFDRDAEGKAVFNSPPEKLGSADGFKSYFLDSIFV